jgi:hypothetical protein
MAMDREFLEGVLHRRAIKGGAMAIRIERLRGGVVEKNNWRKHSQ